MVWLWCSFLSVCSHFSVVSTSRTQHHEGSQPSLQIVFWCMFSDDLAGLTDSDQDMHSATICSLEA